MSTGAVTVEGAQPAELRAEAVRRVCAAAEADVGLFYQLYEYDGKQYLGDVTLLGPGSPDVPLQGCIGAPAPLGTVATRAEAAPWRRGNWSVRLPLRHQRNRFVPLDRDVDRRTFPQAPIWQAFYGPGGLEDHLRALMYDGDTFLGWIGGFRQECGARFERRSRSALDAIGPDLRDLLMGAQALDADLQGEVATYALVDPGGNVVYAADAARAYLSAPRLETLGRLVRQLDENSSAASPHVFMGGVQMRIVRLDAPHEVRYLAVIDQASRTVVSPLHRLTAKQREVCELAAVGCTNDEIARQLGCTPHTVKHHLQKIYEALGIASRAELAKRWHG